MRYPLIGVIATLLLGACDATEHEVSPAEPQVLFVCEHGNVKSLMAASYFNRLASERRLAYHAVSRGTAPNSTTVPPAIVAGLRSEGFDVAEFHPAAISASDVAASRRVILINTTLSGEAQPSGVALEQWMDVPAASEDYAAASAALRKHVEALVDDLSNSRAR